MSVNSVAGMPSVHEQKVEQPKDSIASRCRTASALPSPDCGTTPTPVFDKQGRLWVVFAYHGHVYVSYANSDAGEFRPPVVVNRTPEPVSADGENRPKLAIGPEGHVYVSWTKKTPGRYTGDVRFSRSVDGAGHFSEPVTVNDDRALISHRFDALAVDRKGNIYLVWLDKRDRAAAKSSGSDYKGAALYYAVSTDGGEHFGPNRKVADNSCECCRVSLAIDGDDHVKVLWRHIFNGTTRDHAMVTLGLESPVTPVQRVTHDEWKADVCPHHGPDLSVDREGRVHMTWFTQGPKHQGLMYGRFDPGKDRLEFSRSLDSTAGASHPQVRVSGDKIFTAWKAFDGTKTELRVSRSDDFGATWSDPQVFATTTDKSDHPLLLQHKKKVFVSWHTLAEGFKLIPVQPRGVGSVHARD